MLANLWVTNDLVKTLELFFEKFKDFTGSYFLNVKDGKGGN